MGETATRRAPRGGEGEIEGGRGMNAQADDVSARDSYSRPQPPGAAQHAGPRLVVKRRPANAAAMACAGSDLQREGENVSTARGREELTACARAEAVPLESGLGPRRHPRKDGGACAAPPAARHADSSSGTREGRRGDLMCVRGARLGREAHTAGRAEAGLPASRLGKDPIRPCALVRHTQGAFPLRTGGPRRPRGAAADEQLPESSQQPLACHRRRRLATAAAAAD